MNNELLEQWRKEAASESLLQIEGNASYFTGFENGYIEGCKATHEKMLNLIEDAYQDAYYCGGHDALGGYGNLMKYHLEDFKNKKSI